TVSGEIDVIDGTGTETTNGTMSEATLPAFTTWISNSCAAARSAAVKSTCSSVALTNVVCFGVSSSVTTEDDVKFVPVITSVNGVPPTSACDGESDEIVGASAAVIVSVSGADVPLP